MSLPLKELHSKQTPWLFIGFGLMVELYDKAYTQNSRLSYTRAPCAGQRKRTDTHRVSLLRIASHVKPETLPQPTVR